MRIIVTGASGYIARCLISKLIQKHNLLLVDRKLGLDFTEKETIKICSEFESQLIYHLGVQTSVIKSFEDPIQDFFDNVMGTINILKLKTKIIFTSSGAVYGDYKIPVVEEYKTNPQSYYARNKLTAEQCIMNSGVSYVIFRIGNVYGRKANKGVIKALREGKKIFGDGTHTRDYIYVDDVINALIKAKDFKENETYNLGTGIPTSVNQIADLLKIKKRYTKEVDEQKHICLNIDKIKKQGFKIRYKLKDRIND